MIDQDKMRALREFAERLRTQDTLTKYMCFTEEADAIDLLLAEVEALVHDNGELVKAANAEATLAEQLRAELEAAAADKRDAERYRWMSERFLGVDFEWGRGEDGYGGIPALIIKIPENAKVWGCLDLTVDGQLGRAPASEGEQNADQA